MTRSHRHAIWIRAHSLTGPAIAAVVSMRMEQDGSSSRNCDDGSEVRLQLHQTIVILASIIILRAEISRGAAQRQHLNLRGIAAIDMLH